LTKRLRNSTVNTEKPDPTGEREREREEKEVLSDRCYYYLVEITTPSMRREGWREGGREVEAVLSARDRIIGDGDNWPSGHITPRTRGKIGPYLHIWAVPISGRLAAGWVQLWWWWGWGGGGGVWTPLCPCPRLKELGGRRRHAVQWKARTPRHVGNETRPPPLSERR